MPLYQCEECGGIENTACGYYWRRHKPEKYLWDGIEHRRGMKLCSVCGPVYYSNGKRTEFGEWHGRFRRDFLPKGMFVENIAGGLTNKENGDESYMKYALPRIDIG